MKKCLQAIRIAFSRELVRHLAARLGEREAAVGKALKGMLPLVLCQLVIRTGEEEGQKIFAPILKSDWPRIQNIQNLTEVLALLGGGPNHSAALDAGENLLAQLFGPTRPSLNVLMSEYVGLRPDSTIILLRLVTAILASELVHYTILQQFTPLRLSEELRAAKNQIYNWLPDDLPRWPGFRERTAVKAPPAMWAVELARPYWVLVLATTAAAVLALLVLGALASPASQPEASSIQLAATALNPECQGLSGEVDSTAETPELPIVPTPATW